MAIVLRNSRTIGGCGEPGADRGRRMAWGATQSGRPIEGLADLRLPESFVNPDQIVERIWFIAGPD